MVVDIMIFILLYLLTGFVVYLIFYLFTDDEYYKGERKICAYITTWIAIIIINTIKYYKELINKSNTDKDAEDSI